MTLKRFARREPAPNTNPPANGAPLAPASGTMNSAELEALKRELAISKAKQTSAEARAEKARIAAEEQAKALDKRDRQAALVAIAAKAGAHNPDEIAALFADRIVKHGEKFVLRDKPAEDLDKHFEGYFQSEGAHHVKARVQGGGSGARSAQEPVKPEEPKDFKSQAGLQKIVHGLVGRMFPTLDAPASAPVAKP